IPRGIIMNFQPVRYIALIITATLPILLSGGCKNNDTTTNPPAITPITDDLFPLSAGAHLYYTGYLLYPGAADSAVHPSVGAYAASWTVLPGPSGTWLIQDSTNVFSTVSVRYFQIKKDTSSGDFSFRQTLGPFYRAINATYTDTAVWIGIARPSQGV